LTPPRRGLSLMPRLSICNVVTGWSCAVAWFWGCLARWREPGLLTGWCRGQHLAALGLLPVSPSTSVSGEVCRPRGRLPPTLVRFRGCGVGAVWARGAS
jgi:hypothetical protein